MLGDYSIPNEHLTKWNSITSANSWCKTFFQHARASLIELLKLKHLTSAGKFLSQWMYLKQPPSLLYLPDCWDDFLLCWMCKVDQTFAYNFERSSHPEVYLRKGGLKICSKFTREHPCRSAISINLLHIFRTPFPRKTSEWLLLLWV